jgi:hypothetical protein
VSTVEVSPRIDWVELAQRPQVTSLANVLARRWNLWVGVTTPGGQVIPINTALDASRHGDARDVCLTFMGRADEQGGCHRSLLQWATAGGASAGACHAGFEAVLCPIELAGAGRAVAYASGFISAERDAEGLSAVLARVDALRLERAQWRRACRGATTSADRQRWPFCPGLGG